MASIEVAALSHKLAKEDSAAVLAALEDADIELDLDEDADPRLVEGNLDDDLFAEFLDQLEANDAGCDIYVPADFEEIIECGDYKVGSAHALRSVLEEIRDDIFDGGDDEEEEDAEDGDYDYDDDDGDFDGESAAESMELKDDAMRHLWNCMYKGARTSLKERLCLFVNR